MKTRTALVCAFIAVLAGCSFIDDWGGFTTQPGPTQDAGVDAGREDAPACSDTCSDATGCAPGEVCAPGADDCLTCVSCTGCDPDTCGTVCEIVPGTTQCECAALSGEGEPCADDTQCDLGLLCSDDSCLYQCAVDADCLGLYRECVNDFCFVRSGEVECTNGVDDDGDGFTDCDDFDCASDPACEGPTGGEWERCDDMGACGAGLACRNDVCYRECSTAAECGGDFPECADLDSDGVGECSPAPGCDFVVDAGCDADAECRLLMFDPATGVVNAGCVPIASPTVPVGSVCSGDVRCEARSECFTTDGTSYSCYQWCYMDDPATCTSGTCMPIGDPPPEYMGRTFGVCA